MRVGIVDYGMGNIHSVRAATQLFCDDVSLVDRSDELTEFDRLILPGVGSFERAMTNIRRLGLDDGLHRAVGRGIPLLGVCLGMQLLATQGTENGHTEGLGFVRGTVNRLPNVGLPIPHVGFNSVSFTSGGRALAEAIAPTADFYFVHSYRMECEDSSVVVGVCDYGGNFAAVVQTGVVVGTQFHPEKSQSNGLKLLNAFLRGLSC